MQPAATAARVVVDDGMVFTSLGGLWVWDLLFFDERSRTRCGQIRDGSSFLTCRTSLHTDSY